MFRTTKKPLHVKKTATITIDTCSHVARPYNTLFGPLELQCTVTDHVVTKELGKKPVIGEGTVVAEYVLHNENGIVNELTKRTT